MGRHLAAVLLAALRPQGKPVPPALRAAVEDLTPDPEHERIAAMLATGELRLVLLGALARRHPAWSEIHALAAALAAATGARLGFLPEGGNAVGAALAGTTPHRGAGGRSVVPRGLSAAEMLGANLRAYVLVGAIEAEDFAVPSRAEAALAGRGLRHCADAVCGRGTARAFDAHPADRRLCRDLGHLGQRRGTLAERCGRGASAGRSAARLEGAARARATCSA